VGIVLLSIVFLQYKLKETERVSTQFSNHLFGYPIPPETEVIEKKQFNGRNWIDGGGSGGYWNVVAFIKMSSKLSREDIVDYYKKTKLFPYPKSDKLGVELELYFEDDMRMEQFTEGSYYRSGTGTIKFINSYLMNSGEIMPSQRMAEIQPRKIDFVIQIHSGFKYFMQLD